MNVELSSEEHNMLVNLIEREVSSLGPEIRHTSTRDYREELKADKKTLRALLKRLGEPQTA